MSTQTGPDPLSPAERRAILREHPEREKSRRHAAEAALGIATEALRRLALIDEMAGMGQRDDDPELKARCRHAAHALEQIAALDGPAFRVGTDWCIAWGGEDANDCAGRLEYDDEAEADEMRQWVPGGIVARQTVIRLPWENVPDEEVTS